MYDERVTHALRGGASETGRVSFRNVLAFQNFILMMGVIFALQFVDRSFGPVLPLWVEQVGVAHGDVALVSGILFSVMALTGALGHHFCGKLLKRYSSRAVIATGAALAAAGSACLAVSGSSIGVQPLAVHVGVMTAAAFVLGLGIGAAMTASYSAAGAVIPPGAHGTGFGVLTSASLVGMASSPFVAGLAGGSSLRVVFFADVALMAIVAVLVQTAMVD
jgi:MFS family permease